MSRGAYRVVDIKPFRHPKTGREVMIKYEPNDEEFYANWEGIKYSHRDLKGLREVLETQMVVDARIMWQEVIEVKVETHRGLELKVERFLVGDQAEGARFMKCAWEVNIRHETPPARRGGQPSVRYEKLEGQAIPDALKLQNSKGFSWEEKRPFTPPVRAASHWGDRDLDTWYLPYREETWVALAAVQTKLEGIVEILRRLLDTEEGRKALDAQGAASLRLPEKTEG